MKQFVLQNCVQIRGVATGEGATSIQVALKSKITNFKNVIKPLNMIE